MSTTPKIKGNVRIYAAGGCGVNIVKAFETWRSEEEDGRANVHPVYIDTSRSNITSDIPQEASYLMKDLDGSGKVRRENFQIIADHTRDILQRYPAMDLNIVVCSASGGSGSVIAPSLVSELLDEKKQVITVVVGVTSDRIQTENTLKTIKSFGAISEKRNAPVVMAYFQNSASTPRKDVDANAFRLITILAYVYSRENHELDSMDLANFLNFDKVTTFKPQLAGINMFWGDIPAESAPSTISVATLLAPDHHNHDLGFKPDYQCVGYMPDNMAPNISDLKAIHFSTHANMLPEVVAQLTKELDELNKATKSRIVQTVSSSKDDDVQDNGVIL